MEKKYKPKILTQRQFDKLAKLVIENSGPQVLCMTRAEARRFKIMEKLLDLAGPDI